MKMVTKSKLSKLFSLMSECVENIGIEKTINYLLLMPSVSNKYEKLTDFIIESTCEAYGITRKDLTTSTGLNHVRVPALCVVVVLLKTHTNYGNKEIGSLLNKDRSRISKYITKYNNLSPNVKSDMEINFILEKVESKIKEFKNTLN